MIPYRKLPHSGGRSGSRRAAFLRSWLVVQSILVLLTAGRYVPGPASFPYRHESLGAIDTLQQDLDSRVALSLTNLNGISTDSWAVQITTSDSQIWELYHTGTDNANVINGESTFRIASISKILTIYALLRTDAVQLDDLITKYVPELLCRTEQPWSIPWDQVTLRSLASHSSGAHRDTGEPCFVWRQVSDAWRDIHRSSRPDLAQWDNGLYKVQTNNTCTSSDVIERARTATRVLRPNTRPTYSNAGFTLLGVVLERATGMSFKKVVNNLVLKPLAMNNTTPKAPTTQARGRVDEVDQWHTDLGADLATAGFYSTPDDISKLLRSILRSDLMPQAKLNAWLKPQAWTDSGTSSAYGLGWEHLRTTSLSYDGRPIEIISKSGALQGYHSCAMLIPEMGLGVTVMVAGRMTTMKRIRETAVRELVLAVERSIQFQMPARYAGRYCAPASCETFIVVKADEDGPGLHIAAWQSGHTDMLTVLGHLQEVSMEALAKTTIAKLIPVDKDEPSRMERWRLTLVPGIASDHDRVDKEVFDDFHLTDVDDNYFGSRSLREIEFHMSSKNTTETIFVPALDLRLARTHHS